MNKHLLACAASLALALAPGVADTGLAFADTSDPLALPPSLQGQAVRTLTLQQALAMAIRNNLGIQIQTEQVTSTRIGERASEAGFEPSVSASVRHNDRISPPANSVDGSLGQVFQSQVQTWSASLSKKFQSATSISLNFSSARNKDNSGSAVDPLFYGSNMGVSITQPLLRGFSLDRDIPRASILKARFANQSALEGKKTVIADEVLRTETSYWNLAEATRSYAVQATSLALALEQLSLTQRQIKAGILAPADKISSESSVAGRRLSLVRAEARLSSAMDALRGVLNLPPSQWAAPLLAIDMPNADSSQVLSVDAALAMAMAQRAEIRQNRIDESSVALDKRVAHNERLPSLDLGLSYGLVGQSNVYSGSLSQLKGLGARDWGVFMNLNWAPLTRAARASAEQVNSTDRIRKLRYEQFLVSLRIEIRRAIRDLKTAKLEVVASERFRSLAERSLQAERLRFLNGKSRNLEVSRREEELTRAQDSEISARIALLRAKSALDRATGSLLSSRNIILSVVVPP